MKLHYELRKTNNSLLSDTIKLYTDIVPDILCTELIDFFENKPERKPKYVKRDRRRELLQLVVVDTKIQER